MVIGLPMTCGDASDGVSETILTVACAAGLNPAISPSTHKEFLLRVFMPPPRLRPTDRINYSPCRVSRKNSGGAAQVEESGTSKAEPRELK